MPGDLRKVSKIAGHAHKPSFLCYAATSPWCYSSDQGVVQGRKGFLKPTILLPCIQLFYLAKHQDFKVLQ